MRVATCRKQMHVAAPQNDIPLMGVGKTSRNKPAIHGVNLAESALPWKMPRFYRRLHVGSFDRGGRECPIDSTARTIAMHTWEDKRRDPLSLGNRGRRGVVSFGSSRYVAGKEKAPVCFLARNRSLHGRFAHVFRKIQIIIQWNFHIRYKQNS